jgi:hypothetical protein
VRKEDARYNKNANPARNEEFIAFDQPILAPAPGRIVNSRDGILDNVPGQPNEKPGERLETSLLIDHGNGEKTLVRRLLKLFRL